MQHKPMDIMASIKVALAIISQFPLWDFFECNKAIIHGVMGHGIRATLNSLCGISSNATHSYEVLFVSGG